MYSHVQKLRNKFHKTLMPKKQDPQYWTLEIDSDLKTKIKSQNLNLQNHKYV
jgi:hypothetical protein